MKVDKSGHPKGDDDLPTRAERETRDELIYRLHLAGVTLRDIGKRTGLSKSAVHKIVGRQLAAAARRRESLDDTDQAVVKHLERLDSLLAASYPKAMAGDSRAAEMSRRVLDSIARIQGLNRSVAERYAERIAPVRGVDFDDDDDGLDELERHRLRYDDDPRIREAARMEANARMALEQAEAIRRGITWYDLTAEDRARLHAVPDAG